MKKIQSIFVVIVVFLFLACGGSAVSSNEAKKGYWKIQDSETNVPLYRGFLSTEALFLDQNNKSWSAELETNGNLYILKKFRPLDASSSPFILSFTMNDAKTESAVILLNNQKVKLLFDSTNLPVGIGLSPAKFSNISWTDQESSLNTLNSTSDGSSFTILSYKAVKWGGSCTFRGEMPSSRINYVSLQSSYACTDGSRGDASLFVASNAVADELIIGIESVIGFDTETNLEGHSILFK